MSKFSIITPTYNRAWCIERAIKSVIGQEFQDWELLIVDDGSIDNSREIIKKYLADERIKYFHKENGGVGSARNVGIKNAQGEIIIFLDSDDELENNALSFILEIEKKNPKVNIFAFSTAGKNGKSTCRISENGKMLDFKEFIEGNFIKGESFICYRSKIFLGLTEFFDEEVNGGEGILIWDLIIKNKIFIMDKVLRIYHTGTVDSLITAQIDLRKIENMYKIQKKILAKYENYLKNIKSKKLGIIYYVLARASALLGKKRESFGYFLKGFRYGKIDMARIILYFLSLIDYKFFLNNFLNKYYNKIVNE